MANPSSTQELLDAHTHVAKHIQSFIHSMSLKCAIQLAIPDVINKHSKPAMTITELVDAIPINKAKSDELRRLMRILTHSNFFDKVMIGGEEAYCLTHASRLLLRDGPNSLVNMTLLILDPILMNTGHYMSEWFRNEDSTAFFTMQGRTYWEYAESDQELNALFNKAMSGDARLVTSILGRDCRHVFEGLKSMVDVGGGNGAIAKGLSDAFPGLKCTVLDLPHVVAGMEGSGNLTFIAGDMFQFIPHADAVFFKAVFHNWDDEICVKVLKKCKEAITESKNNGGKVIIVDMVVDDEKDEHQRSLRDTKLGLDILMMISLRGKERSEKEWAKLFFDAGFGNYKISHVLGSRSVIEVFP
nr:flavonoid O-methyltransferase 2 [Scutellaria baicalensis]